MVILRDVFQNPESIFFPPFLLSGIGITLLWLKLKHRKTMTEGLSLLFTPKAWLTQQAALDLCLTVFMLAGLSKIVSPLEDWLSSSMTALAFHPVLEIRLGLVPESLLATLVSMLAYDFGTYAMHRLMHTNSLLWRVHAFHHSATRLTFLTTYRQNPLEPLLLAVARTLAAASSLVLFHLFFPSQTGATTIFGLGAGFFLYMFTVNLHHSPVPVTYPRLIRKIFISPHIHHLHHVPDARFKSGRNYGVIFSLWDVWFGTYHDEEVGLNQAVFGLAEMELTRQSKGRRFGNAVADLYLRFRPENR